MLLKARLIAFRKTIPQRPRTSDLEAKLASFAMEVGVVVKIWKVESLPAFLQMLPSVRVLVGADGRKSLTRQWLLHAGAGAGADAGAGAGAGATGSNEAMVRSEYAVNDTLSI